MSQGESAGIVISGLSGETITRHPGSINGESLTLRDLKNCSVYILDHSSEVEATNCSDCQLFVGPVDGAAIFDSCSGCTVAVASQQFQARGCSDVEFGVYCATAPTVRSCKGVRVGCWVGAYPGLTRHFAAANLDPGSNQWRKVHDATPAEEREEGEGGEEGTESKASFEVVESSPSWWEVPIEDAGGEGSGPAAPPDNPVPAADGALYSPPSSAADAAAAPAADAAAAAAPAPAAPFGSGLTPAPSGEMDPLAAAPTPLENGGSAAAAAAAASLPPPSDNGGPAASAPSSDTNNPAAAQAARAARERLARQEEAERAARAEAQAKAAAFLSDFYAKRDAAAAARPKPATQATPEGGGGGGPTGATPWERVLSLLDLDGGSGGIAPTGSARSSGAGGVSSSSSPAPPPNAADLSRFKAAMFTAKAKGLGL